jgi:RND family efflux transporter MFP subunit
MSGRSLVLPTLLGAAALLASPASALEGGRPPAPVRVETLRVERTAEQRRVTGTVRAVRRALVASREGGIVLELPVREGGVVEKGAVLARLDGERIGIELAEAVAEEEQAASLVEERRAEEERAVRDAEAVAALAARDAARPKERDDAASASRIAAARTAAAVRAVEVLRRRRAMIDRRLADTEVKAPFAGTVTALRTEVGAWTGEGDAVVELVSTSDLEARLDVPQRSLAPLRMFDGRLRVVVDADGAEHDLATWRIVGDVDPASRSFAVLAGLPASPMLAAGMSLTAYLPTGDEGEHLIVSRGAILRGPTGPYVYVAAPAGEGAPSVASMVPVEILFSVGDRAAVRAGGLAAGAKVVVEGNERLFPGAPVIPREDPASAGGR